MQVIRSDQLTACNKSRNTDSFAVILYIAEGEEGEDSVALLSTWLTGNRLNERRRESKTSRNVNSCLDRLFLKGQDALIQYYYEGFHRCFERIEVALATAWNMPVDSDGYLSLPSVLKYRNTRFELSRPLLSVAQRSGCAKVKTQHATEVTVSLFFSLQAINRRGVNSIIVLCFSQMAFTAESLWC